MVGSVAVTMSVSTTGALVTTEWLAENLDDPSVVVAEVDEDPDLYEDGHIPGSVKLHWKDDVTVIGIPTRDQRFAAAFLHDTGLKAVTSLDLELLKKTFSFGDPPYGVALRDGRQISPVPTYDGSEPEDTLRKVGYIE